MENRTLLQWFSQSVVCAGLFSSFVDLDCPVVGLDLKEPDAGSGGRDLRPSCGAGGRHRGCVRPKARSTWGWFAHSWSITLVHHRGHSALAIKGQVTNVLLGSSRAWRRSGGPSEP